MVIYGKSVIYFELFKGCDLYSLGAFLWIWVFGVDVCLEGCSSVD